MGSNRKFMIGALAAVVVLLAAAGMVYTRISRDRAKDSTGVPSQAKGQEGEGHREEAGHGDPHGHEEGAVSDLDRPVEEMWKAKCEHGILQYTCDECRFDVGTVKLASSLVGDKGRPGLVGAGAAGGRTFAESRSFTGEVRLSEEKTVHVASPLPGVVRKVFAGVGKAVKEGEILIEVDSHEVAEAKGDYLKRLATRNLAKRTAEREAALFAKKIAAEAEVLEAQAKLSEAEVDVSSARAKLLRLGVPQDEVARLDGTSPDTVTGYLPIRAPQAGVVLEKHATVGERVETGKELFLISDLSEVWVFADVREGELPAVAKRAAGHGAIPAEVRAPGGRTLKGTMEVVSGTMDEQTRTVKARVVVPNPDGHLRPGMFVTIRLLLPGGGSVLAVPKVAVLADEGRTFVFVHQEGDYWIRRPVKLGRSLGDMVEVASGLSPGQKIITDGSFLLKSDVLRRKMGAGCAD